MGFQSQLVDSLVVLSLFLSCYRLFLQKPANPDLLYIIFFCYTQLTVTLLLCLIFGSKIYIVFRGHGKLEENSSTLSKPTTTFLVKPKSLSSQQNPSIDSAAPKHILNMEYEAQEEFYQLCSQLEILREHHLKLGNKSLAAKISAMQDIAKKDFSKMSSDAKLHPVPSCATNEKSEENSKTSKIEEEKIKDISDSEKSKPQEKIKSKHKPHCRACGGKVKRSSEESSEHVHRKECNHCDLKTVHLEEKEEGSEKEFSVVNSDRLHSGHAKTHSIVINLDDNSRFTDEVTV